MATNMPRNPAPVSGPGALSRRTDGGPGDKQPIRDIPDAAYGEQAEFQEIQGGAPMHRDAPAPPPRPAGMFAPTGMPGEPITAGIASGPGPGPSPLMPEQDAQDDMALVASYLPDLRRVAAAPTASKSFKAVVRYLEQFNGQR
jgi:hypothetical protein